MRIVIAGAGGVGGLLAGLLARAGAEVALLARGDHAEAIRRDGLRIASPLGEFAVPVAAVSDDPAALGPADAVLVAVKAWQVGELAPALAPILAAGGVAVPFQNGVEAAGKLAAALGEERVAGGLVAVLSWIDGPGAIRHVGGPPRIRMGERGARANAPSERLEALAALLRAVPESRALLVACMEEVTALARARGVALPADAIARALVTIDGAPPEGTASMQRDLGAGRPSELEDQVGSVVRLAKESGVPAPLHGAIHALLLPQELAARASIPPFSRT